MITDTTDNATGFIIALLINPLPARELLERFANKRARGVFDRRKLVTLSKASLSVFLNEFDRRLIRMNFVK